MNLPATSQKNRLLWGKTYALKNEIQRNEAHRANKRMEIRSLPPLIVITNLLFNGNGVMRFCMQVILVCGIISLLGVVFAVYKVGSTSNVRTSTALLRNLRMLKWVTFQNFPLMMNSWSCSKMRYIAGVVISGALLLFNSDSVLSDLSWRCFLVFILIMAPHSNCVHQGRSR